MTTIRKIYFIASKRKRNLSVVFKIVELYCTPWFQNTYRYMQSSIFKSTKIKTIVLKEIYLRLIQHYACVTSEKRMKRDIITYVITQVCFQNKSFLPFYNDYYANVCINNITEIAYTLSNGFVSDPSNKMLLMILVRFLW